MMSRSPDRNRRAVRPPQPFLPSASAPRDATCAAPRATSPSGGTPSLSTSSRDVRPGHPLPYPSAGTSSRPASSSLCPSASKPNSLAAASRQISLTSSPFTAGSPNSTCSARPSMSAERYVAKRSGSQGPNSPERWPSLTTSAMVLRHRRASTSRLRRSEEHTSELQSHSDLVCRLLLEKKKKKTIPAFSALIASGIYNSRVFLLFNDTATTEIYTLSLHDALPTSRRASTSRLR